MRGQLRWFTCDAVEGCDERYEEDGGVTWTQLRRMAQKDGWKIGPANDERDLCPSHARGDN